LRSAIIVSLYSQILARNKGNSFLSTSQKGLQAQHFAWKMELGPFSLASMPAFTLPRKSWQSVYK
jgi:hypothetical protein